MHDDPDIPWGWDDALGMFVASFDAADIVEKKAARCREIDAAYDRERRRRIVNAERLRQIEAQRIIEYGRLRAFLAQQLETVHIIKNKKLRSFLRDVQSGKRIPNVSRDAQEERDSLSWFIDISIGSADKRLRRRRLTFLASPMPRAATALTTAWDCWVAGLFLPATVMCRAVLDHALRERYERRPWFRVPRGQTVQMAKLVEGCPYLSADDRRVVWVLKDAADRLLHCQGILSVSGEEETYDFLVTASRILSKLAE